MMRKIALASAATLFCTAAHSGGIERTTQSIAAIFEDGNYLEFSFTSVNPEVSGSAVAGLGGFGSGDMASSFSTFGITLKIPVTEKIDAAIILDQPFGADTNYPLGTNYFAQGSVAELNTTAFTGVVRYKFSDQISAFGGVRYQSFNANATIPFVAGYMASAPTDYGFGYLLGAAYERKEIGLRVALTYNSAISHELATSESSAATMGATLSSTTNTDTPQSVNLEFQTGLNPKTLLFGSVRWVDWSEFDITPAHYQALTGEALVSYDSDTITYNLGVGRRLSDSWSVAGTVTYEEPTGGFSSNLSPTDGRTSVGLGVTYTQDNFRVTTGVSYTWIGEAETRITGFEPASSFTDNTALGFGIRMGFTF